MGAFDRLSKAIDKHETTRIEKFEAYLKSFFGKLAEKFGSYMKLFFVLLVVVLLFIFILSKYFMRR